MFLTLLPEISAIFKTLKDAGHDVPPTQNKKLVKWTHFQYWLQIILVEPDLGLDFKGCPSLPPTSIPPPLTPLQLPSLFFRERQICPCPIHLEQVKSQRCQPDSITIKYILRQQGAESVKGDTEPWLGAVRTCWASWPHLRRLARFLCLLHRCWWTHPCCTRSSGTATAPPSPLGTRSCGISLQQSKAKTKHLKKPISQGRHLLLRELLAVFWHIINSKWEECLENQGFIIETLRSAAGCPISSKAAAWPKDTLKVQPGYCHQISTVVALEVNWFYHIRVLGFFFLSTSLKAETPHKKGLNHQEHDRFKRKALVMNIIYFHLNYYT